MAKNGEPDYDQLGDEGECKVKIICLGDSAVGKSKLVERFLMDGYKPQQLSTYALTLFNYKTEVNKQKVLVGMKRDMKKRWTEEENQIFLKYFKEEIRLQKMPLASKLQGALKELRNRTVLQIRTKINNIILGKLNTPNDIDLYVVT